MKTVPTMRRLAEPLKSSGKLFMDETTAPALDPGRGRTSVLHKSFPMRSWSFDLTAGCWDAFQIQRVAAG